MKCDSTNPGTHPHRRAHENEVHEGGGKGRRGHSRRTGRAGASRRLGMHDPRRPAPHLYPYQWARRTATRRRGGAKGGRSGLETRETGLQSAATLVGLEDTGPYRLNSWISRRIRFLSASETPSSWNPVPYWPCSTSGRHQQLLASKTTNFLLGNSGGRCSLK